MFKKFLITISIVVVVLIFCGLSFAAEKQNAVNTNSSYSASSQVQNNKVSKTSESKKLPAKTSKFKLTRGTEIELCQELKKILNEPENKNFLELNPNQDEKYEYPRTKYIFSNADFVIPKRYKNFSLPAWEDVPITDAPKYMKPGKRLDGITEFNQRYKDKAVQIEMKKTKLDLAGNGKEETILRFKPNDFQKRWRCYVSDIEPSMIAEDYNESNFRDCFFFSYKGKVFRAENPVYELRIGKPEMVRIEVLSVTTSCYFEPK